MDSRKLPKSSNMGGELKQSRVKEDKGKVGGENARDKNKSVTGLCLV